ncbi:hypothetical protein N5P37_008624 [Trichoderma harzianum]|nr:hypothetical protein N5P37_008624 [Trichoderma harzianum]
MILTLDTCRCKSRVRVWKGGGRLPGPKYGAPMLHITLAGFREIGSVFEFRISGTRGCSIRRLEKNSRVSKNRASQGRPNVGSNSNRLGMIPKGTLAY